MPTESVECLIGADKLQARLHELSVDIAQDMSALPPPLVVGILTGAWIFMADLVRLLPFEVTCDFIRLSSYRHGTTSSGTIALEQEPRTTFDGRHVLIMDDIVDTGASALWARAYFEQRAASVRFCTLLDKPSRRTSEVTIDYIGFTVPDRFVFGYGIDIAGKFRNLPYIAAYKNDDRR
ncbi:MAG TPA: hypoxanthine phosphoribosyltransferase [Tepidisphaeraceae bacterium]|jgi:hypoxanthine phosphoribosyltransferase|nr:hypoxanthine phosphoribosyltransferase [Tepidisphaeraceae bacterium]